MSAPQLTVHAGECRPDGDRWITSWRVQNASAEPVLLESAWLPHEKFRAPERRLGSQLAPGGGTTLEFSVATRGEPGEIVENPFLILRVRAGEERWRVLARMQVRFDEGRAPHPEDVVVTSQPVGFWRGGGG